MRVCADFGRQISLFPSKLASSPNIGSLTLTMCFHLFYRLLVLGLAAYFLFESTLLSGNERYEEAERYFEATLFDRAVPLYEEILEGLPSNAVEYDQILLRLAQCYVGMEQFSFVIERLKSVVTSDSRPLSPKDLEKWHLIALSAYRVGDVEQAIVLWREMVTSPSLKTLSFYHDTLYLFASALFENHLYKEAFSYFLDLSKPSNSNVEQRFLALTFLVRIHLIQGELQSGTEQLLVIKRLKDLSISHQMLVQFLEGECARANQRWEEAFKIFTQVLDKGPFLPEGFIEPLYSAMGWCGYHLAESLPDREARPLLQKAEQFFLEASERGASESSRINLAHCYQQQFRRFGGEESLKKMEAILQVDGGFTSPFYRHQALLLQAEVSPTYKKKQLFLRQAINKVYKESVLYAYGHYLYGLNEYGEGKRLYDRGEAKKGEPFLDSALNAFDKVIEISRDDDPTLTAQALQEKAHVYDAFEVRDRWIQGLDVIHVLLNEERHTLFPKLKNPAQLFFLQARLLTQLYIETREEAYKQQAHASLSHLLTSYPHDPLHEETLRLLGTLYYYSEEYQQAKVAFLQCAHAYPLSKSVGEVLLWASYAMEQLNAKPKALQTLRKKIFEEHQGSAVAAEAFFHYYPYSDYVSGKEEAIAHLSSFVQRFPNHPYALNAIYLLALHHVHQWKTGGLHAQEQLSLAQQRFEEIETTFTRLYETGTIPQKSLEHYLILRYQGLKERGLLQLEIAQNVEERERSLFLQNGEFVLSTLYSVYKGEDSLFQKVIEESSPLLHLKEEVMYHLGHCYRLSGKKEKAKKLLKRLVVTIHQEGVTRGYYLSKGWEELGLLSMEAKDFEAALEQMMAAEEAAKGKVLFIDDLLNLWILQSHCYKHLRKRDEAMLLLSKVINYDAVSPKRIEAMYYRSEIYEEQGRFDLAKKQLEAVATKSGEWAIKAREKLYDTPHYF